MAELKVGEIVQLRSGGPKMTVEDPAIGSKGYVRCQWFAGSKLETGAFPLQALMKPGGETAKG